MGNMKTLSTIASLQVMQFQIHDVNVCIDLQYIKKVLPLPLLETVPASQSYLVGLMNFSGKSIPVIDLAWRLELIREVPYSIDTPILLCTDGKQEVGLIVDKILGLASVDASCIQVQNEFTTSESPFLATILLESKLTLLLDINYVFDLNYSLEKAKSDFNEHVVDITKAHSYDE